jgi:predicted RNA binding protein YcfA (HicA-like mRNA interferase family)
MNMKYHELERKLRKIGCYPIGEQESGHPLWHSPITGNDFTMSNHHSREVATGTLLNIMKLAGLK